MSVLRKKKTYCIALGVLIAALASLEAVLFLRYMAKIVDASTVLHAPVAIVFGAGVASDGTPSDMLQDRLDVAARLYEEKKVDRILVSGDNSTTDYDEPSNMMRYLVNTKKIPKDDVYLDFAGRRTYDTCARAKEIWGIEHAILVTQTYHLPRALMLCTAQGIEVQGVSASLRSYRWSIRNKAREVFAFLQAMSNVYVAQPEYIHGKKETDLDP